MPEQGGAAPLPAEGLQAALRPFGESRLLPRLAYVDRSVFEWEERHFLRGGWTCVARSEDVAHAGDQRAEPVGGAGVFLVRGEDGRVRASPTCAVTGATSSWRAASRASCRWWCARTTRGRTSSTGRCGGRPASTRGRTSTATDNGLVELPTEEWHGLVFVSAPAATPGRWTRTSPGSSHSSPRHEPERLRVGAGHDYVVVANWKVIIENYQECYHCAMIHPSCCAVSPSRSGENYRVEGAGAWVGGWMALRDDAETMSLSGRSRGTVLRGLEGRSTGARSSTSCSSPTCC